MAIDVTCIKCHTRFQVSEKFAGKSGPCPKCKNIIKIPELKEQVVIHAPEVAGDRTATGQPVFKPIARTEVRLTPPQIALIVGSVLIVLIAAIVMRFQFHGKNVPNLVPILGAVFLGPVLAFATYTFLRDDELEPFRGTEILVRSLVCGLAFAAIWGAYWLIFSYFNNWKPLTRPPDWQTMAIVVLVMCAIGAFVAQASFELEVTTGALQFGAYLATTVILRLIMNVDPRWMFPLS